jgi:hypothetical protein
MPSDPIRETTMPITRENLEGLLAEAEMNGMTGEGQAFLRAVLAEIEVLRTEVASLRLTLGGKTFSATVPEPIGCPAPGACAQVAEIGRLRAIIRVNGLRAGATHAEIDAVIYPEATDA